MAARAAECLGALVCLLLVAAPAGDDQPLAGRRLVARQHASEERLELVLRDAVALPLPGAIDDPTLYRFTNPASSGAGSEVRSVVLREGRGIGIRANRLGITLDEPSQGALAIVLTAGPRR